MKGFDIKKTNKQKTLHIDTEDNPVPKKEGERVRIGAKSSIEWASQVV